MDSVIDQLEQWRLAFDTTEFNRPYWFSPKWHEQWDPFWARYDELETQRKHRSIEKADWQDAYERYRRESYHLEQSYKSEWRTEDWKVCPLGYLLQHYLRLDTDTVSQWQDALKIWEYLLQQLRPDPEQSELWKVLSHAQQVSFMLLKDWWECRYSEPRLTQAVRQAVLAETRTASVYTFPIPSVAREHLVAVGARAKESIYHGRMFQLWVREFVRESWEPYMKNIHLHNLDQVRRKALSQALPQQMSYTFYSKRKTSAAIPKLAFHSDQYVSSQSWLPPIDRETGMPFYLWDIRNRRTVITTDLPGEPQYTCISHTWGRWREKSWAKIDGVPWLVPRNSKFSIEDLPQSLRKLPMPYVWLDLFCIPQDDSTALFKKRQVEEISRQASIFRCATSSLIWFKDVDTWTSTRAALGYLSALYMHNTNLPGIYDTEDWLHDSTLAAKEPCELYTYEGSDRPCVSSTTLGEEGMTRVSKDLSPKCLFGSVEISNQQSRSLAAWRVMKQWFKDSSPEHSSSDVLSPNPWFTSLWTLQEASLCPNLQLYDRSWDPLLDGSGTTISLHALFMLLGQLNTFGSHRIEPVPPGNDTKYPDHITLFPTSNSHRPQHIDLHPKGAAGMLWISTITRMDMMFERPSPEWLLFLSNIRKSQGSRAQAIMSALGFTDWYNQRTITQNRQESETLVFGAYPLEFVHEAVKKLGATFYFSMTGTKSGAGSLLPFEPTTSYNARLGIPEWNYASRRDHPAVQGWEICIDGSVRIQSVGIVATNRIPKAQKLDCTICFTSGYSPDAEDMNAWMRERDQEKGVFAVLLFGDALTQYGVLLLEIERAASGTLYLEKKGIFMVHHNPNPPFPCVENVDWVVK